MSDPVSELLRMSQDIIGPIYMIVVKIAEHSTAV
jgi:hypothetical protein